MTAAARPRLTYRPELDGLRAVAVLAVLVYHLSRLAPGVKTWPAQGGFLGVDVFFVLSGMLITELLVADRSRDRLVALRRFYVRRARRLLPAVGVMLAVAVLYMHFEFHHADRTLSGLRSLVVFVTTRYQGRDIFPWGVTHVWTLIVEWEFYLIWPLVLLLLLGRRRRRAWVGLLAFAMALAIAGLAVLVYHRSGSNFTLPYFVGGLRFDELLLGCAVALIAPTTSFSPPPWLRAIAAASVLASMVRCSMSGRYLNDGGTFLVALATATIVWPGGPSWWGKSLLSTRPMVWVGKLSYSLYLWSVPVILDVERLQRDRPEWARMLMATTISFALAAASYYLVESRFRLPSRRATAVEKEPVLAVADA